MERPLATGLDTTGAGQASAMHVTELGPSLEMLGHVPQELPLELLELLPGEHGHTPLFEERPFDAVSFQRGVGTR